MNILYGYHRADRGVIRVDGQERQIHSPEDAIRAGIGMVHQHFMLVEPFTVLENLLLGAEGGMTLAEGARRARQDIAELEREYGLEVELDATVADLPVGVQQRVEILKALFPRARILILDEPTGALTPQEADHLFRILRNLRDQGRTVVLITHKLREIMAVTDNVSVMRRGEMVTHRRTAETSTEELAELAVARAAARRQGTCSASAPVLEVADLVVRDGAGVTRVKGVSFTVRAGEIVGIAGVAGNGQSERFEALAGIRPIAGGRVAIKGHAIGEGARPHSRPRPRARGPAAHGPGARARGVRERDPRLSARPGVHSPRLPEHGRHHRHLPALDARLRRAPGRRAAQGGAFSGGNQQKLVLARELEHDPDLLLVGQPTRGVDIGAIEFIHKRLIDMRDAGKAVLLVSVELDEIMSLADRILVMFDGTITGALDAAEADERRIGLLMTGSPTRPKRRDPGRSRPAGVRFPVCVSSVGSAHSRSRAHGPWPDLHTRKSNYLKTLILLGSFGFTRR